MKKHYIICIVLVLASPLFIAGGKYWVKAYEDAIHYEAYKRTGQFKTDKEPMFIAGEPESIGSIRGYVSEVTYKLNIDRMYVRYESLELTYGEARALGRYLIRVTDEGEGN